VIKSEREKESDRRKREQEKERARVSRRGGGLGSRPIFKKFNEPYAPS